MIQTWFWIALIAPFLWAIIAIIDTYFVNGVYRDEFDGTIISGVFQSLPWLLVLFGIVQFTFPGIEVALLALLAGGLFLLSFFFYFRALFISNDATLMQILWGVGVPVVPFFAWILMGEVLTSMHYMGIGIAFLGIMLFNFDGKVKKAGLTKIMLPMMGAIVFLSLSMVIAKEAYTLSLSDFLSVFLIFSSGATLTSLAVLVVGKKNPLWKIKEIVILSRKYFVVFVIGETLSILATIASQKAISLAPSASFVIVIESLVPIFVMIMSVLIILAFRNSKKIDVAPYRNQISGVWIKLLALLLIILGIYVVV
jgi:drug/metabolite transporter (DMT)-like permease